jgi:hypothetical protein
LITLVAVATIAATSRPARAFNDCLPDDGVAFDGVRTRLFAEGADTAMMH